MKKEDNNKVERLLRMHEHAELLSDDDIQTLLDSADKDDDINTLSAVRRAMAREKADISDDEIDRQWKSFETELSAKEERKNNTAGRSWLQIAATFVGILMIAGVAFAAIHIINNNRQNAMSQNQSNAVATENGSASQANTAQLADTTTTVHGEEGDIVEFDDVPLGDILKAMAAHYKLKLQFENEQSKHIKMFFKWNKQSDIAEIVEILNSYNRINIEQNGDVLIVK